MAFDIKYGVSFHRVELNVLQRDISSHSWGNALLIRPGSKNLR